MSEKNVTLVNKEIDQKIDELQEYLKKEGYDSLFALRDQESGVLFATERRKDPDKPVCYRFAEVANCYKKLVDAMLLLRDCFTDAAEAHLRPLG